LFPGPQTTKKALWTTRTYVRAHSAFAVYQYKTAYNPFFVKLNIDKFSVRMPNCGNICLIVVYKLA